MRYTGGHQTSPFHVICTLNGWVVLTHSAIAEKQNNLKFGTIVYCYQLISAVLLKFE